MSVLDATIWNPKFMTNNMRPVWIITPTNASPVQAAVLCGQRKSIRLRIRSGRHAYEGLPYRSERPQTFTVLDLINIRAVHIDASSATAWVGSGTTLGEMYYAIGKSGNQIAFPAGLCLTVGVSGHFNVGRFGMLLRKYGVAADNVIDTVLVDAKGRLLNKNSMGSDVF
jgi:FAD/FMN-containing dehydrogenase